MIEFLDQVTDYLLKLCEANRKLLAALKDYQKLLVEGDPGTIERATPKLDRLTGAIRSLDETRRAFVDDYFNQRGWDGVRNFTAIAEHIKATEVTDEEAAAFERLTESRVRLIEILAEVDAQNSLNLTLIGQGMSFAEVSLRALLGFDSNPSTYGPSDGAEDGPSLLDARA
jgi:hypothetical protein